MVSFSLRNVVAASALVLSAVSNVAAQDQGGLAITSPSSDIWWVAKSQNLLEWTCKTSPFMNFTVLVSNTDPTIAVSPLAIIAIQNNFDCSILITQDQANQPAGQGWLVLLANPLNISEVYATSQPFEIKPLGSLYPSQVTASTVGTASSTGTGTANSTVSPTAKPTGSGSGSGALSLGVSGAVGVLAAGVAAAMGFWA